MLCNVMIINLVTYCKLDKVVYAYTHSSYDDVLLHRKLLNALFVPKTHFHQREDNEAPLCVFNCGLMKHITTIYCVQTIHFLTSIVCMAKKSEFVLALH